MPVGELVTGVREATRSFPRKRPQAAVPVVGVVLPHAQFPLLAAQGAVRACMFTPRMLLVVQVLRLKALMVVQVITAHPITAAAEVALGPLVVPEQVVPVAAAQVVLVLRLVSTVVQ